MSETTTIDPTTDVARSDADSEPTLGGLLRWLLGITRPVHKPLAVSACCRIISLSLDVALFAMAAGTVVHLTTGGSGAPKLFTILVVLALTKATFFYLEQFTGHYVAFKALELLRTYVFARLWPKAPAIVTHTRSGDILTSLTRDVDRIEVVYAHTFAPVVAAYVVTVLAIVVASALVGFSTVWVAGLCLVVSLLVVPILGLRTSMAATRTTLAQRRALAQSVTDSVFGVDEVLSYGREPERLAEADAWGERIADTSARPRDVTGLRRGLNVVLMLSAALSVVWLGGSGADPLSPVVLAALAAAALRVFEAPRGIEEATGYLDHSLAAARRLHQIAHAPERVSDGPDVLTLDHAPSIRFDAVSYTYPDADGRVPEGARQALSDVTFDVPAGRHTMLVGRSGSGKSTLVQLLLRYDDPGAGSVTLDGQPITRYGLDSLRRNIVAVSQKNQLLDTTLAENLRLGAPDATDDEIRDALDVAGLTDEVGAMPDGLDTAVGRNGSALSGGQAQRVCLARALLMDPRVLILDEFTANLDTELEGRIRAALAAWHHDLTIIEITHRIEATRDADVVYEVDAGRIIDRRSPDVVMTERAS